MAGVEVEASVHWRDELGRFAARLESGTEAAMTKVALQGAELAASLAPVRTGELRSSITGEPEGLTARWTVGTDHGMPQEEGAGPHSIGAPGQILANKSESFFARGPVLHPGNPGIHFMRISEGVMMSRVLAMIAANV